MVKPMLYYVKNERNAQRRCNIPGVGPILFDKNETKSFENAVTMEDDAGVKKIADFIAVQEFTFVPGSAFKSEVAPEAPAAVSAGLDIEDDVPTNVDEDVDAFEDDD